MTKCIHTHPDNLEHLRKLFKKEFDNEVKQTSDFIHYINPYPSIKFITNVNIEKERWTGKWKALKSKFTEYWDGQGDPPSWCVYCGFVEKEMEMNFYEEQEPIMLRCYQDFSVLTYNDKRLLLRNFNV